jgi:hypothetical protein
MEYLLRKGEAGLKQDFLIYGKQYKIYRDGKQLGVATFTDDKIHGDVFLQTEIIKGKEAYFVCQADEWELV